MNTTATKIANSNLGTATVITENLINEAMMKVSRLLVRALQKIHFWGHQCVRLGWLVIPEVT